MDDRRITTTRPQPNTEVWTPPAPPVRTGERTVYVYVQQPPAATQPQRPGLMRVLNLAVSHPRAIIAWMCVLVIAGVIGLTALSALAFLLTKSDAAATVLAVMLLGGPLAILFTLVIYGGVAGVVEIE